MEMTVQESRDGVALHRANAQREIEDLHCRMRSDVLAVIQHYETLKQAKKKEIEEYELHGSDVEARCLNTMRSCIAEDEGRVQADIQGIEQNYEDFITSFNSFIGST